MSWNPRTTERLAEYIRFIFWSILFLNALMFGFASVWFVFQVLAHLINLCRRSIFSHPW
jgi:hypothetical protein